MRVFVVIACALVLSSPAWARAGSGSAKSKAKAPTRAAPAAADHDFGCTLAATDLRAWGAQGIRLAANIKSKFKLWKSVSGAAQLSSSARSKCNKLPPQAAFVKGPGAGTVTRADLVVAQQDVTVYRAYSAAPFTCGYNPPALEFGSWWSLTPPPSDKVAYRRATAVCNTWNDFTKKVQCTLKRGTVIAVGPTQSATCTARPAGCTALPHGWAPRFASSPEHQVFINTYRRTPADLGQFLVNCHSSNY